MEYCGAGAVDSLYKNLSRPLNEEEIGVLLLESLKGLEYMHDRHIIHRDIKSGNIFLTLEGQVKLGDFGVSAVTTAETHYRAHSFIGTPYWMAPEVIMAENNHDQMYDCRADIWSIGITAIELADKLPPLSDIHPMRALYLIPTADANSLMVKNPKQWNKLFVAFIIACLVKDPRQRPDAKAILRHPFMNIIRAFDTQYSRQTIVKLIQQAKTDKQRKHTPAMPQQHKTASKPAASVPKPQVLATPKKEIKPPVMSERPQLLQVPDKQQSDKMSAKSDSALSSVTPSAPSLVSSAGSTRTFSTLIKSMFRRKPIDITTAFPDVDFATAELPDHLLDITNQCQSEPASVGAPKKQIPFDLISLDLRFKTDITCNDIIVVPCVDSQGQKYDFLFVMFGCERGLFVSDITQHQLYTEGKVSTMKYEYPNPGERTRTIINNVRFQQMQVLDDYDIMIAISGKTNQVRMYQLKSVRKLIRHVFGLSPVPEEKNHNSDEVDSDLGLMRMAANRASEMHDSPAYWLEDFVKILGTRESFYFTIVRTSLSIYMGVVSRDAITVFEWAKMPYLQFMKVKSFWVPETPKNIQLLHDGKRVQDLIVIYAAEADHIEFESSQVTEIPVSQDILQSLSSEVNSDREQFRWFSWLQLPTTDGSHQKEKTKGTGASWYQTMKSMKPNKSGQKNLAPRYILATYGNQSRLIDEFGKAVITTTNLSYDVCKKIAWSAVKYPTKRGEEEPAKSAVSRTLVLNSQYFAGQHRNYIELMDMKTASLVQVFKAQMSTAKVTCPGPGTDILDRRRGLTLITTFNKKRKISQIYWLREDGFNVINHLREYHDSDAQLRSSKVLGTSALAKKTHI